MKKLLMILAVLVALFLPIFNNGSFLCFPPLFILPYAARFMRGIRCRIEANPLTFFLRQFGQMIGMGYSVKAAQTEMEMVAEGYYGTKAIWLANQEAKVDLPIVEAMYQILYNRRSAKAIIKELTKKFQ